MAVFTKRQTVFILLNGKRNLSSLVEIKISDTMQNTHNQLSSLSCHACLLNWKGFERLLFDGLSCSSVNDEVTGFNLIGDQSAELGNKIS